MRSVKQKLALKSRTLSVYSLFIALHCQTILQSAVLYGLATQLIYSGIGEKRSCLFGFFKTNHNSPGRGKPLDTTGCPCKMDCGIVRGIWHVRDAGCQALSQQHHSLFIFVVFFYACLFWPVPPCKFGMCYIVNVHINWAYSWVTAAFYWIKKQKTIKMDISFEWIMGDDYFE